MAVIEPHIGSETSLQMIKVFERSTSYPFGFQGMEEGLHMGIVLAVVGPVHTDQEAMTLQSIDIRSAPIFHTPVRMKDTAGSGGTILSACMKALVVSRMVRSLPKDQPSILRE